MNQIDGYGAVLKFLDAHLRDAKPPAATGKTETAGN